MAQYSPYQQPSYSQQSPQSGQQYPQQQQFGQPYDPSQQYQQQQFGQSYDPSQQYPQQSFDPSQQYGQPQQYQQAFDPSQQYEQQQFGQAYNPSQQALQLYGQQAAFPPPGAGQYQSPQPVFATSTAAPTEITQLAAQQQLGELRATYAPRLTNSALILGMILGLALLGVVFAVVLFTQLRTVNRLVFALIVLPIVGIIYAIDAFSHHSYRVYLFSSGLIYVRSGKPEVVYWNQISTIWHRPIRQTSGETTYRYEIQRYDAPPLKLGNVLGGVLVHVSELIELVEHEVMMAQLPNALAIYSAGQVLSFGKLSISLQGLAHGSRTLSWNEIVSIEMEKNQLAIRCKDGSTKKLSGVRPSDVPNFLLFQQVAVRCCGGSW
jgi:hypothetical protein